MKSSSWISSLILTFSFWANAQEPVSGFFEKTPITQARFYSYEQKRFFYIKAANQEVADQLKKLETMDAIQGTGEVINSQEIVLHSIDFVGLKRLLGEWKGGTFGFEFHSFVDVSLYNYPTASRDDFKYALVPSIGDQWKMFITDQNQVTLASLSFWGSRMATMSLHDSKTGEVTRTFPMTKVRSQ